MDAEFNDFHGESLLIVGDGDFSFSVAFCKRYNLVFTTSVLESHDEMTRKYLNFKHNVEFLQSHGVTVLTGIDATHLTSHFSDQSFTHILFNFPHAGGKSNIKKNRQLLDDFFKSAILYLDSDGRIMVTLCKGQGGTEADQPRRRWADSWQVAAKATNSGLILSSVIQFEGAELFNDYLSSGFRSQNKRFHTEGSLVHTFIRSRPLPAIQTTADNIERGISRGNLAIYSFCAVLCQAWNLILMGVDYQPKICQQTDLDTTEATDSSRCRDFDIYPAVAEFRTKDSNLFSVVVFNEQYKLLVENLDVLLLNVASLERKQIVGYLNNSTLSIDLIPLFQSIIGLTDARYFVSQNSDPFTFKTITSPTTCEDMSTHICCISTPPISLYPPTYRFDISFWLPDDGSYTIDKFIDLVLYVAGDTLPVKQIGLLDIYSGEFPQSRDKTTTDCNIIRTSHCYTVVYQSLFHSLSYDFAYSYYQALRNACPQVLQVILR